MSNIQIPAYAVDVHEWCEQGEVVTAVDRNIMGIVGEELVKSFPATMDGDPLEWSIELVQGVVTVKLGGFDHTPHRMNGYRFKTHGIATASELQKKAREAGGILLEAHNVSRTSGYRSSNAVDAAEWR